MTDLRKAAEMALEALEGYPLPFQAPIKEALRQALAQSEHEPVAWRWQYNGQPDSEKHFSMPGPDAEVISRASACEFPRTVQYLYTSPPPKREWVGLTDEEMSALWVEYHGGNCIADGRIPEYEKAIEAKLKEKNGG